MNREQFIKEIEKLGIELTKKQLKDLELYKQLLQEENKKYNLTAITKDEDIYLKHFYDSLTIIKSININNQYICDIGTGAGFPGMVLKIIFPNIKMDLIDATKKKCEFLNLVKDKLDLENINIINKRVEEYSIKTREQYDIIVSRAVAPLKHLLEYGIPLLKKNGYFIALKGNIEEELININNYYKKLYISEESVTKFQLPNEKSNRSIIKIKKLKETPTIYPRKYSIIIKKEI